MISQVYILDHLVVRILAQLLSDKGPNLPINRDFVVVLEEDMSEFSQVCACVCVCVCVYVYTYMHASHCWRRT
jgi:ubiquitin-protein ligase